MEEKAFTVAFPPTHPLIIKAPDRQRNRTKNSTDERISIDLQMQNMHVNAYAEITNFLGNYYPINYSITTYRKSKCRNHLRKNYGIRGSTREGRYQWKLERPNPLLSLNMKKSFYAKLFSGSCG